MSRTFKTDPFLIRHARIEGRSIPKDWRDRWGFHPTGRGWARTMPEIDAWWADRPGSDAVYRHRVSKFDRRISARRIRMSERTAIAHADYDSILPVVSSG